MNDLRTTESEGCGASAIWKSWSTRSESPPTDQLVEFKNFMKALCERMGDEVSSK